MTTQEIEIIVEANVEKVVKEFKKLLPAIKKQLEGIQKEFYKFNIKDITVNIDITQITKKVKQVKKQIKEMLDLKDLSGMKIDGRAFNVKNIQGYSKEVQKLKGQEGTLSRFKVETPQIEGSKLEKSEIPKLQDLKLQTPKVETQGQVNKYNIWTNMLKKYYEILNMAKTKMGQLNQETEQTGTSQSKLTGFFSGFKGKLEKANNMVKSVKNVFGKIPNVTKSITNHIKKMGSGIKSGLGHVLKYAGQLFSIKGIYSLLSGAAQSWLSSQNAGAQQLTANMEYLKYSMRKCICTNN